ncbi:hypothetical protein DSL72_006084 [Monilinia vaccinii-corymbosi]|uniref:Uncharacterized protein n=1 Tax=Monilinia vaccinii-corymbosi TaxID=61207 RepID=A0A8A3PHF0_9HELO|nr:hypothetical protein DSL72_006084 [Monilinia vaccinii-corymbosi]
MLTNPCLPAFSTLRAGLSQYRTRCLRLPKQITRRSSTSTPQLYNILQPSIVNRDTPSQITIPRIIYSTLRKRENTADLVYQAICFGYRGIETGAEPLKYEEKLAGDGIRKAIKKGIVKRRDLYIQTTFAPPEGQSLHTIPYSLKEEGIIEDVLKKSPYSLSSPIAEQIHSSIASSLNNLKTSDDGKDTYIDCVILRSPCSTRAETQEAWDVLSTYVPHPIRSLGIASKRLKGIGEEGFVEEEEQGGFLNDSACEEEEHEKHHNLNESESERKESILPSVYMNSSRNHDGYEIGFDIQRYPKQDMVFQSFWSTNDMHQLSNNALTFEICCILEDLGYYQGESRKLALHVLLLALRLHGLTILDGTNNSKSMKCDMKSLKKLEKWIESGKGRLRWMRLERAARMFFQGFDWEEELRRTYTDEDAGDEKPNENLDENPDVDVDESNSQDWDISSSSTRDLTTPHVTNYRPLKYHPQVLVRRMEEFGKRQKMPERDLRGTLHSTHYIVRRFGGPGEGGRFPVAAIRKSTIKEITAANKREIDRMIMEGYSPTAIAQVHKELKAKLKKLKKEREVIRDRWMGRGAREE